MEDRAAGSLEIPSPDNSKSKEKARQRDSSCDLRDPAVPIISVCCMIRLID
jgi:hypothetical protein